MQHAPDYLRRIDLTFTVPGQQGKWNSNFPPKFWRDPVAITSSSTSYNSVGQAGIQKFVVSAAQWDFNIPPIKVDYPPYVVGPTQANIGGSQINPQRLSTRDQANSLAGQLGLSTTSISERQLQGFPVSYGSEERRTWQILFNGILYNVGDLLAIQNEFGVGAPGHWVGVQWVPDPNETVIPKDPPVQVPLRDLKPEESIVQVLGGWVVEDGTDQVPVISPNDDVVGEQLDRIEAKLDKLLSLVGVQ